MQIYVLMYTTSIIWEQILYTSIIYMLYKNMYKCITNINIYKNYIYLHYFNFNCLCIFCRVITWHKKTKREEIRENTGFGVNVYYRDR
jgi:hypothetical protein